MAERGGLLDGECEVPELVAHLAGAVGLPGPVVGEDAGEQLGRLHRVEHVQAQSGREPVPALSPARGDQDAAAVTDSVQQRADVVGMVDVVQHQQPVAVPGEPRHRPLLLQLGRQPGQSWLQRAGEFGKTRVDGGRAVGGDPPPQPSRGAAVDPVGGERGLAHSAQAAHRPQHHPSRGGEGRVQLIERCVPADEEVGDGDVRHPGIRGIVRNGTVRLRGQRLFGMHRHGVHHIAPRGIGARRGRHSGRHFRFGRDVFVAPLLASTHH